MSFGRVTIDFETKSEADLPQVGAWVYSLHETTEVICLCYKATAADGTHITTRGVQEWVPGSPMPADLHECILSGYTVEAHNYAFELAIWNNICVPRYGFCSIMPGQWRCSMAVAAYYAMPQKLDSLLRALRMEGKDPEGGRLISKYSKLNLKTAKREIPPDDLRKFIDYCKTDVLREEAVYDYLGDLPDRELPHFLLDQEINMRGLYLDGGGIAAAASVVDHRAAELVEQFKLLTGGKRTGLSAAAAGYLGVEPEQPGPVVGGLNPTQGAKLLVWFAEQGVKLDNMQAGYLEDLLEEGSIPAGPAREALTIRLQVNKASTKKLDAMDRQRSPDGRARWQARYHGAQTGRDTGSGFQPLNLAKPKPEDEDRDPEQLVRDIMYGDARWLGMLYGDAMAAVAAASRNWIMAEPGHVIMAGDFVSIEAVVLACLAGEDWKIDAFREGKFIYGLMGCKIHGMDPALAANKKQFKADYPTPAKDGKTGELAFGYGGGLGAWLKFDNSGRHTDERIEEIKTVWRSEHPMTTAFWRGVGDAAIEAVTNPGATRGYRDIGFEVVDEWLSMILPNGKRIWYREPELRTGMPVWHKPETNEDCAAGDCKCRPMARLTYMAQKAGQWKRVDTYGPKLVENGTQAVSREYLMPSVHAVKKAGYPVILKVYDEVLAEPKIGHGSLDEYLDILKNAPGRDWANGWPVNVEGFVAPRYRK